MVIILLHCFAFIMISFLVLFVGIVLSTVVVDRILWVYLRPVVDDDRAECLLRPERGRVRDHRVVELLCCGVDRAFCQQLRWITNPRCRFTSNVMI